MKPLLALVAALLVARFESSVAAPQPLSLLNATDVNDSGSITTSTVAEVVKKEEDAILVTDSETTNGIAEDSSSPASSPSASSEGGTEGDSTKIASSTETVLDDGDIVESRSDSSPETVDEGTAVSDITNGDMAPTTNANSDSSSDGTTRNSDASTEGKADNDDTRPTEENIAEVTSEDDVSEVITISRYVPPLDPMKHMLMMAEVKKQLELSSTVEPAEVTATEKPTKISTTEESVSIPTTVEPVKITTVAESSEPSSTHPPTSTTEKTSPNDETVPEETETHVAESSEVEKLSISTLDSETSSPLNDTLVVVYASELISNDTDKVDPTESSPIATEKVSTESLATAIATETSTVDVSTDSALDINHESSILIRSSELFSGKNDSSIIETSTQVPESEKDGSAESDGSSTFTESPTTVTSSESFSTNIPHSSTDVESDKSSEEASLVRSDDEIDSVEISESEKISTSQPSEKYDALNENQPDSSNAVSIPSVSYSNSETTTTSVVDAVTEEIFEKLSASQDEAAKNFTLEEELEFRAGNLSFDASDVVSGGETTDSSSKIEKLQEDSDDQSNSSETSPAQPEEITTTGILTTIQDIIFGFSTITPEIDTDASTTKSPDLTSDLESEIRSDSSLDSNVDETIDSLSESELPIDNPSSDVMKVELVKADIDSISTESPSILSSSTSEVTRSDFIEEDSSEDLTLHGDELSSASETVNEDSNLNERTESVSKIQPEATTISEMFTTEETPLKSELLKSSDPISVTEVSSDSPVVDDSKSNEKHSVNFYSKDRYVSGNNSDSVAAVQFLHYHDKASSEQCFKLVDAHWKYATNLTDENKKKQLEQTLEYSLFHKEAWKNATSFAWKSFNDTLLRRWFKSLSVLGTAALPEDKLNEFNRLKAEMKNTYSTAKVCPYVASAEKENSSLQSPKDCKLTLEPDLQRILTKSRDYDELAHVWKAWRDAAGKPIREKYLRFVNLSNEAARLNGFSDTGDMWREAYESDTFAEDLEMLWNQLKPLYAHLHAYVRRKLIQEYGNDKIRDDGPIPAHLFGNMWAQSWVSLLDITQPFAGKPSVDVTPIMEAKNLSALEMFKISEEFFTSLGLKAMPEEFWKHSLIEKPQDREIICHASAWDFCNGKDYRIKQCTDITMEDLITVHHEMGHIQYFLQYARQPNVFREGANPGFHEAIGDVLALSVSTPKHLQSIGLLEEVADDPEGDLNFLLRTALDKVSFLPSGYLIDLWRWGLFSGDIQPEEMNTKWWDLRLKYQGICPPVKRHDTDFDPGAKYHVPGNVPYIRYFVSFVIQFQFHKVLCDASGHTGPLYKCDIYRSKEAGQILSQVMELGSSEHWSEAMKIMTGGATSKMDAGPILEYFQPLLQFLEEQNQNETLGWRSDDSTICP